MKNYSNDIITCWFDSLKSQWLLNLIQYLWLEGHVSIDIRDISIDFEFWHISNLLQGNYIVAAKENNQQSISGFFKTIS